jgi:hypothetical protein
VARLPGRGTSAGGSGLQRQRVGRHSRDWSFLLGEQACPRRRHPRRCREGCNGSLLKSEGQAISKSSLLHSKLKSTAIWSGIRLRCGPFFFFFFQLRIGHLY